MACLVAPRTRPMRTLIGLLTATAASLAREPCLAEDETCRPEAGTDETSSTTRRTDDTSTRSSEKEWYEDLFSLDRQVDIGGDAYVVTTAASHQSGLYTWATSQCMVVKISERTNPNSKRLLKLYYNFTWFSHVREMQLAMLSLGFPSANFELPLKAATGRPVAPLSLTWKGAPVEGILVENSCPNGELRELVTIPMSQRQHVLEEMHWMLDSLSSHNFHYFDFHAQNILICEDRSHRRHPVLVDMKTLINWESDRDLLAGHTVKTMLRLMFAGADLGRLGTDAFDTSAKCLKLDPGAPATKAVFRDYYKHFAEATWLKYEDANYDHFAYSSCVRWWE